MKKIALLSVISAIIASCCPEMTVTVTNGTDFDRHPEMVELCACQVTDELGLNEDEGFVIRDAEGKEQPYQVTSDGKVIFQVEMKAGQTATYKVCKGTPSEYETIACGRQYPERADDFAWENDLVGFRAYGPALQARGERGFGYDLFAKRGTHLPVLEGIYARETDKEGWAKYKEMRKKDDVAANRFKFDSLSYHVDRGHGMDVYQVGPTLGAGTAALLEDGEIVYPWCYDTCEVLDNGPLRMRVRLTYKPSAIGKDGNVVETRVITLDAGSRLNRTSVSYAGLSAAKEIVTGIVLQDKDRKEVADAEKGYIAYPAPSINPDKTRTLDNGIHYVGHVHPVRPTAAQTVYFSDTESKEERNGSKGHVLAYGTYEPGSEFTYYWGFGWTNSDMKTYQEWLAYLETFSGMVRESLKITINN